MITTIIADDEVWVCQLIKRIVNWEELNFSIIGEAYDGDNAFELIKSEKPGLVITDIRMPGLDGISLIKSVKELGIDTNFIIISGYSDFEYAKGALKYGALGYLLKPIDRKELKELLTNVRESVFAHREKLFEERLVKGRLARSLSQLLEQFLLKFLLSDSPKVQGIDIEKLNQEYELKFEAGGFQVILFKFDHKNSSWVNQNDEKEFFETIERIISSDFEHECFDLVMVRLKNQLVCILNYPLQEQSAIENSVGKIFDKIRSSGHLMRGFDLTVGKGSLETDFNSLPKSYYQAQNSIKARVTMGVNRVIDISKNLYTNTELKKLFSIEKEMKLTSSLEVFDYKAAEALIAEVLRSVAEMEDVNPTNVFDVANEIVEVFYKVIRRMDMGIERELIGKNELYEDIGECKSVAQILDCFIRLFEKAGTFYNSLRQSQNRKAIEMVKAYICDHYMEEISLNDVASLVFLNPKYLGELFKKEAGINFSDYLINYRMEVAKELLKDIRYKTSEVAELVGYKDAKHFSKLFKKIVGVNPAEYKKMFA